jgi:hypothetical protein
MGVKNCSPVDLGLQQNNFIGSIENIQDCEAREVNLAYLQAMAQQREAASALRNIKCQKETIYCGKH